LSNLGDLSVYSLPNLKRQVQTQCMKQQDINAITSFVFSKFGQAFYLQSPSEFLHISMSARDTILNNLNLINLFKTPSLSREESLDQKNSRSKQPNNSSNKQTKSSTLPTNGSTPPPSQQSEQSSSAQTSPTKSNILNHNEKPTSPPPPVPAPRTSSNRDAASSR
jgi:hypothetical protein